MWEQREDEKLSPVGENCLEIWRVLASLDRRSIVETVLRENASLGTVDPELDRLVVSLSITNSAPSKFSNFLPQPAKLYLGHLIRSNIQ